ncbi:uncharacterized protein LOC129589494 [Paramacrobiotus metropolitanus]|uniref:uncharacterized protein LOC129589494 n=1 Tax=Paramacrobiotus metropolitanus TaxID=2943436 RepID=UPI002445F45E|nr:uncharacterized protein LOC129589494 [Paramacrobiotus metropolitanus]
MNEEVQLWEEARIELFWDFRVNHMYKGQGKTIIFPTGLAIPVYESVVVFCKALKENDWDIFEKYWTKFEEEIPKFDVKEMKELQEEDFDEIPNFEDYKKEFDTKEPAIEIGQLFLQMVEQREKRLKVTSATANESAETEAKVNRVKSWLPTVSDLKVTGLDAESKKQNEKVTGLDEAKENKDDLWETDKLTQALNECPIKLLRFPKQTKKRYKPLPRCKVIKDWNELSTATVRIVNLQGDEEDEDDSNLQLRNKQLKDPHLAMIIDELEHLPDAETRSKFEKTSTPKRMEGEYGYDTSYGEGSTSSTGTAQNEPGQGAYYGGPRYYAYHDPGQPTNYQDTVSWVHHGSLAGTQYSGQSTNAPYQPHPGSYTDGTTASDNGTGKNVDAATATDYTESVYGIWRIWRNVSDSSAATKGVADFATLPGNRSTWERNDLIGTRHKKEGGEEEIGLIRHDREAYYRRWAQTWSRSDQMVYGQRPQGQTKETSHLEIQAQHPAQESGAREMAETSVAEVAGTESTRRPSKQDESEEEEANDDSAEEPTDEDDDMAEEDNQPPKVVVKPRKTAKLDEAMNRERAKKGDFLKKRKEDEDTKKKSGDESESTHTGKKKEERKKKDDPPSHDVEILEESVGDIEQRSSTPIIPKKFVIESATSKSKVTEPEPSTSKGKVIAVKQIVPVVISASTTKERREKGTREKAKRETSRESGSSEEIDTATERVLPRMIKQNILSTTNAHKGYPIRYTRVGLIPPEKQAHCNMSDSQEMDKVPSSGDPTTPILNRIEQLTAEEEAAQASSKKATKKKGPMDVESEESDDDTSAPMPLEPASRNR